jgi:hypothetical protein
MKKGLRETNPVHGVEKPTGAKRMRRLSDAEYAQLGSALDGRIDRRSKGAFLFLFAEDENTKGTGGAGGVIGPQKRPE